jgi:hypothetical protein
MAGKAFGGRVRLLRERKIRLHDELSSRSAPPKAAPKRGRGARPSMKCYKRGSMRAVRARIFALLAALVLLLPGGASGRSQYYCQMLGRVVASCCCEMASASQAPGAAQELEAADCCQRISSSTRGASLSARDAFQGIAAAVLPNALAVAFAPCPRGDTGTCTELTQAPLAIGPPLFVAHCALLT